MPIPEEQKIKLESMQMKGVKWMIWQNIEKEDIESRLLRIKNQSSTQDVQKFLNSQNRATLIALIEQSPEISPQIIDDELGGTAFVCRFSGSNKYAWRDSELSVVNVEWENGKIVFNVKHHDIVSGFSGKQIAHAYFMGDLMATSS